MLCFGHETKTVDPQKNIRAANQKRVKSERCETACDVYLFEFVGGKILHNFLCGVMCVNVSIFACVLVFLQAIM
jgi:hypothetical protein